MKRAKIKMDHIIAAVLLVTATFLLTAVTNAQLWNRQLIEGATEIEIIPDSVQVDDIGRIHIVHRRDGKVIYHRFDGTAWMRENLPALPCATSPYRGDATFRFCLDPDDFPLIDYCENNASHHLSRDEEGWKPSAWSCS